MRYTILTFLLITALSSNGQSKADLIGTWKVVSASIPVDLGLTSKEKQQLQGMASAFVGTLFIFRNDNKCSVKAQGLVQELSMSDVSWSFNSTLREVTIDSNSMAFEVVYENDKTKFLVHDSPFIFLVEKQ